MTAFPKMQRHFQQIDSQVRQIVRERQADVQFGTFVARSDPDAGRVVIGLSEPTLIWRAPARGSSNRTRELRAVFVDGSFTYEDTRLVDAKANLAVYSLHNPSREECKLSLLDSMHFDVEKVPQTPFHPIFHVQRGHIKQSGWAEDRLKNLVSKASRLPVENISIEQSGIVGCRDVRIPTPQMDYISVLLAVIADFFGDSTARHQIKAGFEALLKHVRNGENIARQAQQAEILEKRWTASEPSDFCVAHWYEESVSRSNA